jgi:hypothetical protein
VVLANDPAITNGTPTPSKSATKRGVYSKIAADGSQGEPQVRDRGQRPVVEGVGFQGKKADEHAAAVKKADAHEEHAGKKGEKTAKVGKTNGRETTTLRLRLAREAFKRTTARLEARERFAGGAS